LSTEPTPTQASLASKTVAVQYFAVLREQRGLATENVTTHAQTAAELFEALRVQHGFTLGAASFRVAINEEFAPWHAPIAAGDRIVFLPPVAGG
jgi:molybdopterin synthase sulfur carrier subunit